MFLKTAIQNKKKFATILIKYIVLAIIALTFVSICIALPIKAYAETSELHKKYDTLSVQAETMEVKYSKLYSKYIDLKYDTSVETTITEEKPIETDSVQALESKEEETVIKEYDVPDIDTSIKYFTDYRYYNLVGTPHYALQQECWTDEYGCRRFNDDYCVAVGSYYSTQIGDRFRVTLSTGKVITVIVADGKWDLDCDFLNQYMPCYNYDGKKCGNLLEFIVDDTVVDTEVYNYGSLDYYEEFKGSVTKMEYLGRDTSQDWDYWAENWEGK